MRLGAIEAEKEKKLATHLAQLLIFIIPKIIIQFQIFVRHSRGALTLSYNVKVCVKGACAQGVDNLERGPTTPPRFWLRPRTS